MSESAEGAFITPGVGSITNAAGKVFTITVAKVATESGKAMSGGTGTGAMCYHNRTVYGQDAANGQWFTWSETEHWTAATSPVSASALVSTVTLDHINAQRVGVAFTVHGTFEFERSAPVNLQFGDDKGALKNITNVTFKPGIFSFSYVHPGYNKAGTYTLIVGAPNGATAQTNSFIVE